MTDTKLITYTLEQMTTVVAAVQEAMQACPVITLEGPLGAGKTTLVRSLLHACGVDQPIQSPTFAYVQTYINSAGQIFHHFDLYRITSIKQFQQAGFDEYLYQPNSWVIIEWPEVIEPLLLKAGGVCEVSLTYSKTDEHIRMATVRAVGSM
jgi:tRNA threonylcarbamoyladenosine biosynthesis protein TsaE